MRRILATAVLVSTATLAGCASEPPAVSQQVQQYYDEHVVNAAVSPTARPVAERLNAAGVRALIASGQELHISVLGDSTGDEDDEWVALWAEHLSAAHTVRYFMWDDATQSYPVEPRVKGSGPVLTIWNGSRAGSTPKYAADRHGPIQPQKPDVVIYNYGHNSLGSGAVDELKALSGKVEVKYGPTSTLITLQNPAQGTRAAQTENSVNVLRAYAAETGTSVIDAFGPMSALPVESILADEVHPNPQGSRVWADTVIATLG